MKYRKGSLCTILIKAGTLRFLCNLRPTPALPLKCGRVWMPMGSVLPFRNSLPGVSVSTR